MNGILWSRFIARYLFRNASAVFLMFCRGLWFILITASLIAGCTKVTPAPAVMKTSQSTCKGHLHVISLDEPRFVQARLLTRNEIANQLEQWDRKDYADELRRQLSISAQSWLIEFRGRWQLVGGPEPTRILPGSTPSPTQPSLIFNACWTVIDQEGNQIIQGY